MYREESPLELAVAWTLAGLVASLAFYVWLGALDYNPSAMEAAMQSSASPPQIQNED